MGTRRFLWVAGTVCALGAWWALGTNMGLVKAGSETGVWPAASSVVGARTSATQSGVKPLEAKTPEPTTPTVTVCGPAPALGVIEVLDTCAVAAPEPVMVAAQAQPCQTQPTCLPPREPAAITPPIILSGPCEPDAFAAAPPTVRGGPGGGGGRGGGGGGAPVPEPTTLALAGLAGAAAALARRFRKRRNAKPASTDSDSMIS